MHSTAFHFFLPSCTHTYMHSHTHTTQYIHTRAHTHTHARTPTCTHVHTITSIRHVHAPHHSHPMQACPASNDRHQLIISVVDAFTTSIKPATLTLTQLSNMLQAMAVIVHSERSAFKLEESAYTAFARCTPYYIPQGPPRSLLEWLRNAEIALNFHSG